MAGAGSAERPPRTRGVVVVAAGTHVAARVALIGLHGFKLNWALIGVYLPRLSDIRD